MHIVTYTILLHAFSNLPYIQASERHPQARPRSIDAVLVDTSETSPEPSPSSSSHINIIDEQSILHHIPILQKLDLRDTTPKIPFLRHLEIRQAPAANAAAGNAAGANAGANAAAPANGQAAGANANANAAAAKPAAGANANAGAAKPAANQAAGNAGAQQPAAPVAPAAGNAPVAGVGGGGAPAAPQPGANAGQANPVTVVTVQTVIGGVTKQVPSTFSQAFGPAQSAPSVKSGSIGMGTLTGKVGVVKTDEAKGDAVPARGGVKWSIVGVIASWTAAMTVGGMVLGVRLI